MSADDAVPQDASDEGNSKGDSDRVRDAAELGEDATQLSGNPSPELDALVRRIPDEHRQALLDRINSVAERFEKEVTPKVDSRTDFTQSAFVDTSVDTTGGLEKGGRADKHAGSTIDRTQLAQPTRYGRYEIESELGRGGMGVVYRARHIERGELVALKVLPDADAHRLHRFKREFRSLAEISHPNLIGLRTLEEDQGRWYFTMDLVDGVDFRSYVQGQGSCDEKRLRQTLPQLVSGIAELHRRKIVHRDLKPSNVLVDRQGQVKILDFGLVLEFGNDDLTKTQLCMAGTPLYAAPEQFESDAQPASDLYCLGVMLYEALTGNVPFSGSDMVSIMRRKLSENAPPITQEGLPSDLISLAQRLLNRDPAKRPAIDEIRDGLQIAETINASPEEQLIGREDQLRLLDEALHAVEESSCPQAIFVSGKSGEGKSSMVEQFLRPLRADSRYTVLSGRCYDRESVPFKAIDSLIDALCSRIRQLGSEAGFLIPDDIGMLASLFPVFTRLPSVQSLIEGEQTRALDERQVRQRAFAALRSMLRRLSKSTKLILFTDDLQWGDSDSAEALLEVLSGEDAPPVLLIGSFRSDEADQSDFLRSWEAGRQSNADEFPQSSVEVGPLTLEQCRELVASITETQIDREELTAVFAEAGGNPFLLTDLLRCVDPATGRVERIPLSELIERKLSRLGAEAREMMTTVCVSGQSIDFSELASASGIGSEAMGVVIRLRNERLLRLSGSGEQVLVDTYHDKVRESLLSLLDTQLRTNTHLKIAETIEAAVVDQGEVKQWYDQIKAAPDQESLLPDAFRVFDLAYHFDAAGCHEKARLYALLAAEQACRQSSLEVAAREYAVAERNSDGHPGVDYRVAANFGETLSRLAEYQSATKRFDRALELASTAENRAFIRLCQGELSFKNGAISEGSLLMEKGLEELQIRVPQTLIGQSLGILGNLIVQLRPIPDLKQEVIHGAKLDRQILKLQLLSKLSQFQIFKESVKMLWAHLRSINLVYRLPVTRYSVFSVSSHACYAAMFSLHRRGNHFGRLGRELAQELDDKYLHGEALMLIGIGCQASARYQQGVDSLEKAADLLEETGGRFELNMVRFHLACCQFGLGRLQDAIASTEKCFQGSCDIDDSRTMCASWIWTRVCDGQIPFERLRKHIPDRPDDVMSTVHARLAEASWHSHHGRFKEMLACCKQAASMVRKNRCINSHTFLTLPMLARASRELADHLPASQSSEKKRLRKRSLRLSKWATRAGVLFPAAYPMSLRELASAYVAVGNPRKAAAYAKKSIRVAEKQEAIYEVALSDLLLARIEENLRSEGWEEHLQSALATVDSFRTQTVKGSSGSKELELRG